LADLEIDQKDNVVEVRLNSLQDDLFC
jgi:hypothetical protein